MTTTPPPPPPQPKLQILPAPPARLPFLLPPFLLIVVLGTLSLVAPTSSTSTTTDDNNNNRTAPPSGSPLLWSRCERFHAFEPGIAEDLLPWYDDAGISAALMDRTLATRTMSAAVPGLPLCVRGGRLFVIGGSQQSIGRLMPWQAENIVVYAHALSRLVARWGPSLPDVEFVVETMDSPSQDLGPEAAQPGGEGGGGDEPAFGVWGEPHGRLPVMRHCKTASSPDIMVPTFHFYTLNFDDLFVSRTDRFNAEHPWGGKLQQAFAAGTSYHREQRIPSTTRQWDGVHAGEVVRFVRSAFSEYLSDELRHPNITYTPGGIPIEQWARYKMVMHLDGITCSSRLWQLLALGSVVLREQSGYFAFYDRLLRKFHHFVPFWSHRPREVLWAYNWGVANDAAAAAIAARGQQFVREYLNREALECYWALLLRQYARLLRFKPGERRGGAERRKAAAAAAQAGAGMEGGEQAAPRRGAGEQPRELQERQRQEDEVESVGGEVRQLELVPIAEWLAAQEGRVRDWPANRVAERLQQLNLLPKEA